VACSRSFCFSITSSTALTVAHDTGFPPYCKAHQSNRHSLQHKSLSSSSSSATLHCGLWLLIRQWAHEGQLWSGFSWT
jgi:hypothetical protein